MAKGKGKKAKREAKLQARKARKEAKLNPQPKTDDPAKIVRRQIERAERKARKAAIRARPPRPPAEPKKPIDSEFETNRPIAVEKPAGPETKPFKPVKVLQHAKWPALFKKHIGILEAHIKSLDRIMQSMRSQMMVMPEKERIDWELGKKGSWRVISEMMDRARDTLCGAKIAAEGVVSQFYCIPRSSANLSSYHRSG
jgi:hypothetical protein